MTSQRPNESTMSQLRRVKDSLTLSSSSASPPDVLDPVDDKTDLPFCVNCGYTQEGQIIDRCPECGLVWASRLRDLTPWSTEGPSVLTWVATAWKIVSWDEHLRIRTSLIPATPASRRFAMRNVILTTLLVAVTLVPETAASGASPVVQIVTFLINLVMQGVIIALLLIGALYALRHVLKGIWRRRLSFIPSSIDYATVWWPLLAIVLLLLNWLQTVDKAFATFPIINLSAILGGVIWAMWLWASVSESGHIDHVGIRIFCTGLACSLLGIWVVVFSLDSLSFTVNGAVAKTSASLASAKTFLVGGPPASGPKTYALIIDVIPSGDELVILDGLARLGATTDQIASLYMVDATLENIERAFATAAIKVRPEDEFILYINGHGSPYGAGSIKVKDGEITAQKLRRYLSSMSTNESFVIIDSCFGGKFIEQLRDVANAVVLASTDDRDLAYTNSGLMAFWQALKDPASDSDHDGDVTVKEAFWFGYRKMLKAGDEVRLGMLEKTTDPNERLLLDKAGYATPQFEVLGTAKAEAFAAPVKKAASRPR